MARQDDYVKYTIRVPRDVYARISQLPGEGSINSKIVNALDAASGETLRDRFAMAALDRMISLCEDPNGGWDPVAVAAGCYTMADAMMAERQGIDPSSTPPNGGA